jgi:hypothetical protein
MQPTPEQLAVLKRFQDHFGKNWKQAMRDAWEGFIQAGSFQPEVQQLRNTFGPRWLNAYRIGDTKVGYLAKCRREEFKARRGWLVNVWAILDDEDQDLYEPWCRTKGEARQVCRLLGVTLIEERK